MVSEREAYLIKIFDVSHNIKIYYYQKFILDHTKLLTKYGQLIAARGIV